MFLEAYLPIFVMTGLLSALIFILGLYFVIRRQTKLEKKVDPSIKETAPVKKRPITITSKDINAIAGDDIIATQLDLARAYIETGRKKLAKKILDYVVKEGSALQQEEAARLSRLLASDTKIA